MLTVTKVGAEGHALNSVLDDDALKLDDLLEKTEDGATFLRVTVVPTFV